MVTIRKGTGVKCHPKATYLNGHSKRSNLLWLFACTFGGAGNQP